MSFVPLSRSQLGFIADEFWPGGGENGDGRDLYGVAEHREAWREETTDADLIAEALHPSDADYFDREGAEDEDFDRELDEMEIEADDTITLNGRPLDEYDDLPNGDDGPDTLELEMAALQAEYRDLQRRRWNEASLVSDGSEFDGLVSSCTSEASLALTRFERDGAQKQSVSTANAEEFRTRDSRRRGWPNIGPDWLADPVTGRYRPNPRWNGRQRFDSWKRHREAQHRLRQISPLVTDPAYRDAA